MSIDDLLLEWSYKCQKGYPEIDNPSDMVILESILNELNIPTEEILEYKENSMSLLRMQEEEGEEEETKFDKKDLIGLIQGSELTPSQIQKIHKNISNLAFRDDIISHINKKGFTPERFKAKEKAINKIFDSISETDTQKFLEYLKNPLKLSDINVSGNFHTEMNLPQKLVIDLINIEPGPDSGGSSVGKAEVFLGIMFSDVSNTTDSGDLSWKDVGNLEVKGTGGRLGQQAGRGGDSKFLIETLAQDLLSTNPDALEEYIKDLEATKYVMPTSIKDLYELAIKDGKYKLNHFEISTRFQNILDKVFFDKGVAKDYFSSKEDFKDVERIKKNLIKLNAVSYAKKTNTNAFLFLDSKSGKYVIIMVDEEDKDELNKAVDAEKFDTSVKGITGYKWYDVNPNMVVR